MHIGKSLFVKALGLVALVALPWASRADDGVLRCDPATRWEDFSSLVLAIEPLGAGDLPKLLTLALDRHDDGNHLVSTPDGARHEIVWIPRLPHELLLANDTDGPGEVADAGVFQTYPIGTGKQLFPAGPCEMHPRTRYPVDLHNRDEVTTGELELEGNAVRFTLRVMQPWDSASFTGKLVFHTPRGSLPTNLPVKGWTIFRDKRAPVDGEASRFDTLGEFLHSLPPPAAE